MLKKTVITMVLSFALLWWATPMVLGADLQAEQIVPGKQTAASVRPIRGSASYTPVGAVTGEVNRVAGAKDFCSLYGVPYYAITDWFMGQEWYANYQDPEEYGCVNVWPFEVVTVGFNIIVDSAMSIDVQGYVLDADLTDPQCPEPGAILCQTPTYTVSIPGSGHWIVALPMLDTCCVYDVYFAAIYIFTDLYGSGADAVSENDPSDTCRSYMDYGAGWEDLVVIYGWPGEMLLWSEGYTEPQNDCPIEEWPNHKMHFPQLPDLEGWDVYAVAPKTLADDWQCSATGPVLDIHFWGSWKDVDGDPETDDFYTPMPWFGLSIHRNIPADADTPYSRPGEQIWWWDGEIQGVPFEPPAMEHWFNPNTGEVLYNDHVPYWRYDFFFDQADPPPNPFTQYKDSIYWLNIAVHPSSSPPPYEWGWKSSRDHFMDDATYTDSPPDGPWFPLFEPPRANWFDVYFNSEGTPEDMGSTNYYGAGWYRYEYWWNMWFYNNPFVPNPKHIWLEFNIDPVGPYPYAEFAVNWSTDLWYYEGEPGRPPLPGDDETLYIGREVFPVSPGPNTIDFWIDDYNPEWVSIDFVATDVVINGWIWHECVQTSMDLAFVITGEEVPTGPNHFKTWLFEYQPFDEIVFVQDQFMEDSLYLTSLELLSNPVTKVVDGDTFDIIRPDDHLTWYKASGRDTLIQVEYVNQFESTTVAIDYVEWLLVPTQKEDHAPPVNLDHYKAYNIQNPMEFPVQLSLEDQFDVLYGSPEFIEYLWPRYFLTPAIKNMEHPQLFDSVTHYVAYEMLPTRYFPLSVNTEDQFGTHVLNVMESMMLLVPSRKRIAPPCLPPNINCPADETQNANGVYTTTTQWSADDGNPGDPNVWLTSVTVDLTMLPPGITAAGVNIYPPGLPAKTATGDVWYTVGDHCQPGGPIYLIATNNCLSPPNADTCSFVVTLTNDPPDITQPDSLEGYADDVVEYDITGNDPNGDVIADDASITIEPDCGTYSITRTAGHGTSSGTWHVRWSTFGCTACITHLVIHDLTDTCGATSYCTTKVHLSESPWHWKDPYEDYAPNGMVDIDQRQDAWIKYDTEQWSFCGPCAVANCFKWFDSKYNVPPGAPGDGMDQFPLVRQYIDALGGMICPYDDHDPWNVDHPATSWNPGIGPPPPTVPQPFVPGAQPPGMPPWGELVERLAWYFDTDGIRTEYCSHTGTNVDSMQAGIDAWLRSETFPDGSSLADTLCEVTTRRPTFAYVESLVEKCEDVILLLGFWYEDPPGSGEWYRIGGHYVTVAGVNSEESMIAFSDPFIDAFEMGMAPGRVGDGLFIPHPHGYHDPTIHNDEGNVCHDIYVAVPSPSPGGLWGLPEYPIMVDPYYWSWNFFNQNVPDEFVPVTAPWNEASAIFTEVEYCVHISPWDYRGDCNQDGTIDIGDVICMINYLFTSTTPPDPLYVIDTNCDGIVDIGDVITLINYLFTGTAVPRCCDP